MASSDPEAGESVGVPASPPRTAPSPSSGSLTDHSLPRLLLDAYRTRFSGALALTRNKTTKRIVFQDGAPVASESNLAGETLGIQLVDQGQLSQDDHTRVSAYMRRERCREGVALLALELLEAKGLFLALKEQVRRRLIEAFAWATGDFEFQVAEDLKKEVQSFRSDPYLLVREGLLNHWSADRLLEDLGHWMDQYPRPSSSFNDISRRLVDDEVATLFAGIDGTKVLGRAIGSGLSSPMVLASVWILVNAGGIQFSEAPHVADTEEIEIEPEIEIEILSTGGGPQRAGEAVAEPAADSDAATGRSADVEAMRSEVMNRKGRLADLNYYELLEIAENASTSEIRKAYFQAAKRYHPDTLARLELNEIKQEAALVFGRIAEANDVLTDADKRREYDAALHDESPEIDVNALGQAETAYRKGEILMRMGDFKRALEFFRPAVELWPDEGAYQSALGWALYKQPRSDPEQATVHLQRAIELDEEDAISNFRLSVVLRSQGDSNLSAHYMARAKILDPKLDSSRT